MYGGFTGDLNGYFRPAEFPPLLSGLFRFEPQALSNSSGTIKKTACHIETGGLVGALEDETRSLAPLVLNHI